jgi:PIN domain nuclease of toxin-antitoxin system
VRLLLDTHILLWTIAESRRLSAGARALIGDAGSEIAFSIVSLWEVAANAHLNELKEFRSAGATPT